MLDTNPNEWFLPDKDKNKVTIGTEIELLLFDSRSKTPLSSMNTCEEILQTLYKNSKTRNVYHDYYPYQLEIRTNPSSNPKDIINEIRYLYKEASKVFFNYGIYVIPVPAIVKSGYKYCGMHLHINYPEIDPKYYFELAMGMYPYILSLTDHCKNFEIDSIIASDRLSKSSHIALPFLTKSEFMTDIHQSSNHDKKFKDIIFSNEVIESSNKKYLVKPNTIEVRSFDTPSLFLFTEFIVEYISALASYIRKDNPMIRLLYNDEDEARNLLFMTRHLAINQRYGVNKILANNLNSQICESFCKQYNIKFPKETQFEFREKLGLSANVNGFLTMVTKGGWD